MLYNSFVNHLFNANKFGYRVVFGGDMMSDLKWYAGGAERKKEAMKLIESLMEELPNEAHLEPLRKMLVSYHEELIKEQSAIPYILSRFNIEVSKILLDHGITLAEKLAGQLKELSHLSNIRYGY